LDGIRVLEIGDEQGEHCGLTLSGLGAEVIKVEAPDGSPTRNFGPFFDDSPSNERSLYFWAYNRGKKSIVLDSEKESSALLDLIGSADVLLDSSPRGRPPDLGLDRASLLERFPSLIVARMSPFGDDGPWADYKGSDLVHLCLGGPVMNCGYDPKPDLEYDLAPIAPQAFHAYQIAGDQLAFSIVAALIRRLHTGRGQYLSCAVHQAVSSCTEGDLMSWICMRAPFHRMTARHARYKVSSDSTIAPTKDGRLLTFATIGMRDRELIRSFLERYGMADGIESKELGADVGGRPIPGLGDLDDPRNGEYIARFVRKFTYADLPWQEMQEAGILCSPIRKPHENFLDQHWHLRGTFTEIEHPEIGRSLPYPTSKWIASNSSWQSGRRAPLVGEDTVSVLTQIRPRRPASQELSSEQRGDGPLSRLGKPFALKGVRVLDFSWFLATAGGTRIMAAFGADVLKVEWKHNPDTRFGPMPIGGRAARDKATEPLPAVRGQHMGGQFNNKNPGKRGISLNVRDPRGLEIAKALVAKCDVVAEGFSPGVMDRFGLGYDVLREINPRIIYAQQSGMGNAGSYGRCRTVGPIAAAFAGQTEMSGFPEPAPPAGWGYSYLDWVASYSFALAILSAIYQRELTGEGQWIDASQCEVGINMTALQILEWSALGREWTRVGNRSPYKPAAPTGIYRCKGPDRWIGISCNTDAEWVALAAVAGHSEWATEPRFSSVADRYAAHDELDRLVESWTTTCDPFEAMHALQTAGVPAGVAQTTQDRCDDDPQLRYLQWLTELPSPTIGTWPVLDIPVKMSDTPPFVGGMWDHGAPDYGEHNFAVLNELLGLSESEVNELAQQGVV
jgi:crotonobetainyl-CoA:carnitine CoA-transferase CaiB-like acyl-CoA transferase